MLGGGGGGGGGPNFGLARSFLKLLCLIKDLVNFFSAEALC